MQSVIPARAGGQADFVGQADFPGQAVEPVQIRPLNCLNPRIGNYKSLRSSCMFRRTLCILLPGYRGSYLKERYFESYWLYWWLVSFLNRNKL